MLGLDPRGERDAAESKLVCTVQILSGPREYLDQGRKKKIEGDGDAYTVLITAEGRASDITVTKSLEPSLDQQAVTTVGTWIFEPARDASGAPVAVRQNVEISFHMY